MKLLAIDDLADNLVSMAALLRTYLPGCETETALSGEEGIEKARTFQPDTILLNIQMPVMDGFEVCLVLKGDSSTRHIPVIFLTAQNTDPARRIRGLEIGGDAFLSKPLDPGELTAQVKAMVRIKRAEDRLRGESHLLEQMVARRTAALEGSESRLRFALEGANDGLWDVQMKTGEVYLSPRGCEILGYTPEELPQVAQVWSQLVHPDDMPRTMERLTAHIEGRVPLFRVEQRLHMKSGEWKWVMARGKVVTRDAQGNPLRIAGTHTDITERKGVEDALRESEERFRALVETAPEAIFIQTGGSFAYVNGAALRLFGAADSSELLGHPVEERMHPGSRAQIRERIRLLNEERKPVPAVDETFLRLDGSGVDVAVSAVPFVFQRQIGALVLASDITERKRTEAALREQLDELRRWHEATLGREMRVLELKREVNELLVEAGRPRRYTSVIPDEGPAVPVR